METESSFKQLWSDFGFFSGSDYFEKISNGFDKLYCFVFDNRLDSASTFDLLLLYSFVVVFLAFLVASVFAIFEQDQRSLQEIKSKVKFSSAVIANLAAAFWAIRETKFKSISYEGYIRIIQNKHSLADLQNKVGKADGSADGNDAAIPEAPTKKLGRKNRSLLPKIAKVNIPPQKKFSGLFNSSAKNKTSLRTTISSTSTRLKSTGSKLISNKSQCIIVDKGVCAPKFCRKTVHIDETVTVH